LIAGRVVLVKVGLDSSLGSQSVGAVVGHDNSSPLIGSLQAFGHHLIEEGVSKANASVFFFDALLPCAVFVHHLI
jgi:hypothetical protein